MQEQYQKTSGDLNLFLVFELTPGTTFVIVKYSWKFFCLVVHYLTIFDSLVQKRFCVFPKIDLVVYAIRFLMS